jgi:tetratricopeptide (TPR) repeat protein
MRIRLNMFFLLLATLGGAHFAPTARAADAVSLFETGNKFYEERKFSEAAAVYETALDSGQVSPALYFNLGNALFKSGSTGRAIVAYRRAAQLTPRDPDVRANLQFARNRVEGPTLRPTRWQRAFDTLSLNEWAALSVAGLWLTFILLAAVQLRPALKPALRSATAAAGGVTLLIASCLIFSLAANDGGKLVVVTAKEATVRKGPFEESESAFAAHDGAELQVLDRKDDWLQVSDGLRRNGWVRRGEVAPVGRS